MCKTNSSKYDKLTTEEMKEEAVRQEKIINIDKNEMEGEKDAN